MDTFLSVLAIVIGMCAVVGLAILILRIVDRIQFPPESKEEAERRIQRTRHRLHHPDFSALEHHFGHAFPASIKALYANKDELDRTEFEIAPRTDSDEDERKYVAEYEPADMETYNGQWPGNEQYFRFADDGCGNMYMVDPRLDDPPVLFFDHETGDTSQVCASFTEFMKWPRLKPS